MFYEGLIHVYGLKNCDTCRKARRALEDAGYHHEFVDFRLSPIDKSVIQDWLFALGEEILINRKSTTWRNLDDNEKLLDPIHLLGTHPTLIKRPVIVHKGGIHVGWSSDVRQVLGC